MQTFTREAELAPGPEANITQLASTLDHSYLDPLAFFVSWQGVLTLAYK